MFIVIDFPLNDPSKPSILRHVFCGNEFSVLVILYSIVFFILETLIHSSIELHHLIVIHAIYAFADGTTVISIALAYANPL